MDIDFLTRRLSVPSRQLGAPGPDPVQVRQLLDAAIRVPDHGRLSPFRLIAVEGDARTKLGHALADIHRRNDPDAPDAAIAKDRQRFEHAPLVVVVVARLQVPHKVPADEQLLSAGCVAYNLLLGAQALGFGAQWLTGWAAYDRDAAALLGLEANERIVAFVHIGTPKEPAPEHPRPVLADLYSEWR